MTITVLLVFKLPPTSGEARTFQQVIFEYFQVMPLSLMAWPAIFYQTWVAFDQNISAPILLRFPSRIAFALRTFVRDIVPIVLVVYGAILGTLIAWTLPLTTSKPWVTEWSSAAGMAPTCLQNFNCDPLPAPWLLALASFIYALALLAAIWSAMVALHLRGLGDDQIRLVAIGALVLSTLLGYAQTFLWHDAPLASAWMFSPEISWEHTGNLYTGLLFLLLVTAAILSFTQYQQWRAKAIKRLPFLFRYSLVALALGLLGGVTVSDELSYPQAFIGLFRGRGNSQESSSWSSFVLMFLLFAVPSILIAYKSTRFWQSALKVCIVTGLGLAGVGVALLILGRNGFGIDLWPRLIDCRWLLPLLVLQNLAYFSLARLASYKVSVIWSIAGTLTIAVAAVWLRLTALEYGSALILLSGAVAALQIPIQLIERKQRIASH